jgi:hypothetical protein
MKGCLSGRVLEKWFSCFESLSTNGKSPKVLTSSPFALRLSKGERRVFQQPATTTVRYFILVLSVVFPTSLFAAAAPAKVVFTFGGLNERSGVLFVAKDAGIFQKHGLDAQVVNVRSGPVGMAAIASGETQFHGGSATGASIGAMAGGLDLTFVAGLINKLDGTFVVSPNIKTPADLKGKRIGVQSIGGGAWMFTILAFDHWGLNPERDNIQFRVIGDQSVMAQALAAGGGLSMERILAMRLGRSWSVRDSASSAISSRWEFLSRVWGSWQEEFCRSLA